MLETYFFDEDEIIRFDGLEKQVFKLEQNGESVSWRIRSSCVESNLLQINLLEMLSSSNDFDIKQELLGTIGALLKGLITKETDTIIIVIPDLMAEGLILKLEGVLRKHGVSRVTLIRQSGLRMIDENLQFHLANDKIGLLYKSLDGFLSNSANELELYNNSEIYFNSAKEDKIILLERFDNIPITKVIQLEFSSVNVLHSFYTIRIFASIGNHHAEISLLRINRESIQEGMTYLIRIDFKHGYCGKLKLMSKSGKVLATDHIRIPSLFYNI